MKKIFIILYFISFTTQAQASKEKVQELIKVMQADKMINQMMDQMIPVMQNQFKAKMKTEEQQKKFTKINAIILEEAKLFSLDLINGPMVDIYSKYFNTKDINKMIKFYQSKTGKKMVELTPTITAELMKTMIQTELPKFQQKIKAAVQELK